MLFTLIFDLNVINLKKWGNKSLFGHNRRFISSGSRFSENAQVDLIILLLVGGVIQACHHTFFSIRS